MTHTKKLSTTKLMKLKDYPAPYRNTYGAHLALIRMGFSSDNIYVAVKTHLNGESMGLFGAINNVLTVQLETQGKKFHIAIHPMGDDSIGDEILEKWRSFLMQSNDPNLSTHDELESIFLSSKFGNTETLLKLVAALTKSGLEIPAIINR